MKKAHWCSSSLILLNVYLIVLPITQRSSLVLCLNVSEADRLYTQLLKDYNKKLLPLRNQSATAEVQIFVYLGSINKFDELSGEFDLTAMLNFTWREERMTWFPGNFDGTTSFLISPADIWRPKLFVRQSYVTLQNLGDQSDMLRISSDGLVVWTIAAVFKVICSVDVTFFPFDSQTCTVSLTTLSVRSEELQLQVVSPVADSTFWETNSQWCFLNGSVSSFAIPNGPSGIKINVTLKRRSEFYIIYIVVPLIFLAKVNNLVFYIPVNSGERISVAITAYLSFAVFMQIINNSVPQSSAPIAYIYFYIMFLLIYSSYIMFACIVSIRIYSKEGPIPNFVRNIVLFLRCSCCKSRKTNAEKNVVENSESYQENVKVSEEKHEQQEVTWELVGRTFDIFCSIFNFLFFTVFTTWLLLSLYFNSEFIESASSPKLSHI